MRLEQLVGKLVIRVAPAEGYSEMGSGLYFIDSPILIVRIENGRVYYKSGAYETLLRGRGVEYEMPYKYLDDKWIEHRVFPWDYRRRIENIKPLEYY